MNDVFIEQLVVQKKTPAIHLKRIGLLLGILLVNLIVLFFGVLRMIFPVTFALSCWFLWIHLRDFNIEFEYSFTNGDLDIDKIIGRRKREQLVSVRVRKLEILAPMTEEFSREFNSKAIRSRIDASIGETSENRWFARFTDEQGIDTLIIFNPNARLLSAMSKLLPHKFKGEIPSDK